MFKVGDVGIARVEESLGHGFNPGTLFPSAPPDVWRQRTAATAANFYDTAANRLISSVHTWVVRTDRHTILIDTCGGNHKHRPMMPRFHMLETPYLDRLRQAGVTPDAVDFVVCTHLHVDHVGWNTRLVEGRWVPAFPKATYLIARREVEFWSAQATAGPETLEGLTHFDSVQPILDSGRVELVEDGFALGSGFTLGPAPGHTPGQLRADLSRPGGRALFSGDVMHHPIQIENPDINSCFCNDVDRARATRHQVLEHCAETGALLLPAHFGRPHGVYVKSGPTGFSFVFPE